MDRYEFYSNLQSYQKNSLEHYGIIGQKWGKRRWQNSDGTFNEAGKERYFGKKIGGLFSKKKVDDIFNDDKTSEKFTKDLGLKTKGKYSWEDNLKTVRRLNKDLYDSAEGRKKISDNTENIIKLVKALDNNDKEEYLKILDNVNENDKTVVDLFSKDVRKLKDWYEETEENIKEIKKSQNNLNPYFEYKLRHEYEEYDTHDVGYPGSYVIEDYNKGTSKSAKATKLINENPEKYFNNILDKLYDELTDKNGNIDVWNENNRNLSKNDFKKMMINQQSKLVNSGNVNDNGSLNLFLNDGNLFWGHVFDIDYNPITGNFEYYGIEG